MRSVLHRKTFDSITASRLGQIAVLALGFELFFLIGLLVKLVVSPTEQLFGSDFVAFWTAAHLAVEGHAIDSFRPEIIEPIQRAILSVDGLAEWRYPPTMHLVIFPLGLLSFSNSLLVFTLLGICAILFCTIRVAPHTNLFEKILLLGAPVVFLNFIQGQNGVFITLIFTLFLLSLKLDRPKQAGFWAALLLIKPHLALLLPVVLVARQRWDVIVWGAVFGFAFCVIVTLAFGPAYWVLFLENTSSLRDQLLDGQFTPQHISAFMFSQMVGLSNGLATGLQILTAALCALACWVVWRDGDSGWYIRIAILMACSPMLSPYALYYDAVMSAVALFILFLMGDKRGFLFAERPVLILIWLAPISLSALAGDAAIPIVYPAYMLLIWSCFRRYQAERLTEGQPLDL